MLSVERNLLKNQCIQCKLYLLITGLVFIPNSRIWLTGLEINFVKYLSTGQLSHILTGQNTSFSCPYVASKHEMFFVQKALETNIIVKFT